jgi:hypothetical protein
MAWIFSLWVEAEKDFEKKAIKEYFNKRKISTNDKEYAVSAYESGMITVDRISEIGITSQSDADEMTSIGFEFYALLKNAPDFRYAMAGLEVDGFATIKELMDDAEFYLKFKGFVIKKDLYETINGKKNMEIFSENHYWNPYEGEIWNEK